MAIGETGERGDAYRCRWSEALSVGKKEEIWGLDRWLGGREMEKTVQGFQLGRGQHWLYPCAMRHVCGKDSQSASQVCFGFEHMKLFSASRIGAMLGITEESATGVGKSPGGNELQTLEQTIPWIAKGKEWKGLPPVDNSVGQAGRKEKATE